MDNRLQIALSEIRKKIGKKVTLQTRFFGMFLDLWSKKFLRIFRVNLKKAGLLQVWITDRRIEFLHNTEFLFFFTKSRT